MCYAHGVFILACAAIGRSVNTISIRSVFQHLCLLAWIPLRCLSVPCAHTLALSMDKSVVWHVRQIFALLPLLFACILLLTLYSGASYYSSHCVSSISPAWDILRLLNVFLSSQWRWVCFSGEQWQCLDKNLRRCRILKTAIVIFICKDILGHIPKSVVFAGNYEI